MVADMKTRMKGYLWHVEELIPCIKFRMIVTINEILVKFVVN